jgi:hypothetical protein
MILTLRIQLDELRDPRVYVGLKIVELADLSSKLSCYDQACDLIDLAYRTFDESLSEEQPFPY